MSDKILEKFESILKTFLWNLWWNDIVEFMEKCGFF